MNTYEQMLQLWETMQRTRGRRFETARKRFFSVESNRELIRRLAEAEIKAERGGDKD